MLVQTWEKTTFHRVCFAALSRSSNKNTLDAFVLRRIIDAAGPDVSISSLHGGPHVLEEAFSSYLGCGYRSKLVMFPFFDLRLLKRCLQRTAATVLGSLDPILMTKLVSNRLKSGETCNWLHSERPLSQTTCRCNM